MKKYKTKKGIVYKNQFHVIWTVKYRKELLTGKIEERLKEIIYEVCQEKEVELKAIEVMPDHMHVFIDVDPRQPLHLLIKAFKGQQEFQAYGQDRTFAVLLDIFPKKRFKNILKNKKTGKGEQLWHHLLWNLN